jgi:hypothetical protein
LRSRAHRAGFNLRTVSLSISRATAEGCRTYCSLANCKYASVCNLSQIQASKTRIRLELRTNVLLTDSSPVRLPEAVAIRTGDSLNQVPFVPGGYVDCRTLRCSSGTPFRIKFRQNRGRQRLSAIGCDWLATTNSSSTLARSKRRLNWHGVLASAGRVLRGF